MLFLVMHKQLTDVLHLSATPQKNTTENTILNCRYPFSSNMYLIQDFSTCNCVLAGHFLITALNIMS